MNPFTRRSFLKGLGTTAIAGAAQSLRDLAAADANPAASADSPEARTLGPDEVTITLDINGAARALKVEPRVTLLDALRNRMEYTAAKEVCDRGTCGACTVSLNGRVHLRLHGARGGRRREKDHHRRGRRQGWPA